ncbi:MAG: TonB-dependent receptor plug domain-containing protein [Candidatus Zixiibacteriota bacterium]
MHSKRLLVGLGGLLSLLGQTLSAQEPAGQDTVYQLEEIVVTATRYPLALSEAAGNVTVITREEIEQSTAESLGGILLIYSGIDIGDHGPFGSLQTASLRGSWSNEVLILLDGRPYNNPQNGSLDLNVFPLESIERVEVVDGALSSLYGASAVGGVINIITKAPKSTRPYSQIHIEKGKNRLDLNKFQFGKVYGENLSLYLTGSFNGSDGYVENSDYDARGFTGKLSYFLNPSLRCLVWGKYRQGELGVPGSSPNARQKDRRSDFDFELSGQLLEDQDTKLRLYGSHIKRDYKDPDLGTKSLHKNTFYGVDAQQSIDLQPKGKILFGFNAERRKIDSTDDGKHSTGQEAVFGLINVEAVRGLKVGLAARLDRHSVYGVQFSPGVSLRYEVWPDFALYSSAERAFRAPNFDELYGYYPNWQFYGNQDLRPERSFSFEGGAIVNIIEGVRLFASYYDRRVKDIITTQLDPVKFVTTFVNKDKTVFNGFNLKVEAHLFQNAGLKLNYDYLRAKDVTKGEKLLYRPEHSISGYLTLERSFIQDEIRTKLWLGGEYIGGRTGYDYSTYSQVEMKGVPVANIKVTVKIIDFEIFYALKNLLDEKYQLRIGYPMPRRIYKWGFTWEFWD